MKTFRRIDGISFFTDWLLHEEFFTIFVKQYRLNNYERITHWHTGVFKIKER